MFSDIADAQQGSIAFASRTFTGRGPAEWPGLSPFAGVTENTLYASLGGHTGVPELAGEDAVRFFACHLGRRPR